MTAEKIKAKIAKPKTETAKAKVKKPVTKKKVVKKIEVAEIAEPKLEVREPEMIIAKDSKEMSSIDIAEAIKNDKSGRYFAATGARKTSIARVRLYTQGEKAITINGKTFEEYFTQPELRKTVLGSLDKMKCVEHFGISAVVRGGGINSQAEAIRHGISKALVVFNADFRKRLRRAGYLTRDPRARERKKFGLRRARRAPQWAKR